MFFYFAAHAHAPNRTDSENFRRFKKVVRAAVFLIKNHNGANCMKNGANRRKQEINMLIIKKIEKTVDFVGML